MQDDLQLISKLKELKNISPSKEWVVLSKIQILDSKPVAQPVSRPSYIDVLPAMVARLFQNKRYAYAFAALAILAIASVGAFQFGFLDGNGTQMVSPAALAEAQTNVEMFKAKSKELATIAKNNPKNASVAINDVKTVARELTQKIQKDPGLAKEVALEINNNKTYLDISSDSELKEASNELYKEIVEQMVSDLEKSSLTESQEQALQIAKELYEKKRYADALESILLLSMAIKNN